MSTADWSAISAMSAPGGEGSVGTGDHEAPHAGVAVQRLERIEELGQHLRAERVEDLGAVQARRDHAVRAFDDHMHGDL